MIIISIRHKKGYFVGRSIHPTHPGWPRPHRRNLFVRLRALGWCVEGLNLEGALGLTASHDGLHAAILVGHGGFILQPTVDTAFQAALKRVAAHKLACNLNAHQATAASNILRTAPSLSKVGAHPAAPRSAAGPSARATPTVVPTGVG